MSVQVHIYLSENRQIKLLLEGQAQGAATFPDFETFTKFIEGCQGFIKKHSQSDEESALIPQPFLDAFDDDDQR